MRYVLVVHYLANCATPSLPASPNAPCAARELAFHLDRKTGGLARDIERGTNGISFLLRFTLFNIVPTLLEIVMVTGILLVAFNVSYVVAILVSVVIYVIFSIRVTEWRTSFLREANNRDNESNSRAIDSLLNYETVKYFNNEGYEAEQYDNGRVTDCHYGHGRARSGQRTNDLR